MSGSFPRKLWWCGLCLTLAASGCALPDHQSKVTPAAEEDAAHSSGKKAPTPNTPTAGAQTENDEIRSMLAKNVQKKKGTPAKKQSQKGGFWGAKPDGKGKSSVPPPTQPTEEQIRQEQEKARVTEAPFVEALMTAPPLSGENPKLEAELKQAGKGMNVNLQRLMQVAEPPTAEDKEFLLELAASDVQPLAPRALYLLRHCPGKDTASFLQKRLKSVQAEVRAPALASLGVVDPDEGRKQAESLINDTHTGVRITAALVLGSAASAQSAPALRKALATVSPASGIYVAWALTRCGGREDGLNYLRALSRLNNPEFAVQAMRLLSGERDPETIRLLFENLYSRWNRVQTAAAESLANTAPAQREAALRGYVAERRQTLELRMALLLYQLGKQELPADYAGLLDSDNPADRLLALDCALKRKSPQDLPVLIPALADRSASVREQALLAVRAVIRESGLPEGPEMRNGRVDSAEWARWWMRQYQVLAAIENRALVRDPLGATKEIERGDHLAFHSEVKQIRPGSGPERRAGAAVEIDCGGSPVVIQPE